MPGMVEHHLFWITSRAAGIAALLFASAAVAVGLTLGGRLLKGRGPDLRITHEALWMATGIIGGWMMILLGVSYYARTRIGIERWRKWHRFTALGWLLGLAHALGQGTDAGR